MADYATIKTLLFTFGPMLIPKLISYIRSKRSAASSRSASEKSHPIPLPARAHNSLNILYVSAVIALISTLPYFAPLNIFRLTNSRLQIPVDVLFTRLAYLSPPTSSALQALKPKLLSMESRLLYLMHGPDPLLHCPFCSSDDPNSYIYYSLPSLLAPHLAHLFILGLATSPAIGGASPGKWRTQAAILGALLPVIDMYLLGAYDHRANLRATILNNIDFYHWRMRITRGLIIAASDLVLALLIYLAATRRAFVVLPTLAERIEDSTRALELASRKLHALGVTRNAVVRDDALRAKTQLYWETEGRVIAEVFDDREVVDGVRAVCSRVDVAQITREAEKYADSFIGGLTRVDAHGIPTSTSTSSPEGAAPTPTT
ncbi:MAG: hypothetical protein M1825_003372 [Sarcosagium campestre]|nr:MAG: hypothetical protein M1825_003372 [Sarcosagium campestre]